MLIIKLIKMVLFQGKCGGTLGFPYPFNGGGSCIFQFFLGSLLGIVIINGITGIVLFATEALESDGFEFVLPAATNSAPSMTCCRDKIWYDESLSDIVIISIPLSI